MKYRPLIYLASPYSDPTPAVRAKRFLDALHYTAEATRDGEMVFSPIVHSHPLALGCASGDWDFWREFDLRLLSACDILRVLQVPGWEKSRGVSDEIRAAIEMGKKIEYVKG